MDVLRKVGATVKFFGTDGAPDLVVGYRGKTYLMETKRPEKRGWASEFTDAQVKFRSTWNGAEIHTVYTPEQAIDIVLD